MLRPLPLGMTDFNQLCAEVKALVEKQIPQATLRDIRFIVATNIMHIGPTETEIDPQELAKVIFAGAAKQVASQVFQDIKIEQQEERDAAKALAESQPKDDTSTT